MFTQVDRNYRASSSGLGIGLALAKSLVGMHGGTIEAHSAGLGEGSEFIVRLPMAEQASSIERAADRSLDEGSVPTGLRILVVDDNRDAASSLGSLLEMMGNDVEVTNDGETAIATFRAFRPSIMLLDLGMPGMSGYEVARRIRLEPGGMDVKLVALTGWGRDEDRGRTKAAGFDAHCVKPMGIVVREGLLRSITSPRLESEALDENGPEPPAQLGS
jgi:CheY-like chemotaxis protein